MTATDPLRELCAQLDGVFLGSTCYYSSDARKSWSDCFTSSEPHHATPARIYTLQIANRLVERAADAAILTPFYVSNSHSGFIRFVQLE